MKITLIALAAIVTVILFIYIFVGLERVWEFTSGNPDLGAINIETLEKAPEPNQYLLCPEDYCAETPDTIASTYDIPASELFAEILLLLEANPKSELLSSDERELTLRFLTRSPALRFPDTTNIEVIEISNTQSTLAIYAQAKMGVSDLGANKKRIDAMVEELETRISQRN
ncbi:DUF1499 domain-containing protein [Lentilitoribacter sp. EG35]|jgi:uncharacterized protein (DUF1499 family)|uniref:DUF1499 domain-containing protein n=1 Tax=Lentilitoribacter sp. EG35 TaxID=3234192 RepID=UPI00345F4D70